MARFGFHDPVAKPAIGTGVTYAGKPVPRATLRSCNETATRQLGGKPTADLLPLIREAGQLAGSDPRRVAPGQAWVSCMKKEGHTYSGEGDPVTEFVMGGQQNTVSTGAAAWGKRISEREIAVARAGAACQEKSRNIDTQVALLTAYERQALDEHADLASRYQRDLDRLLARAADVIVRYPAPENPS